MDLNLVFGRAFHPILMHLFCYIQCFEVSFSKNLVFLSKSCFSIFSIDPIYFSINRNFALKFMWASAWFDWSKLIFDQSKIGFQIFLKQFFDCFKNFLFKKFFNFSSLSNLARILYNFLSFSSKIFARFSSLKVGMTILTHPPFCFIFMISCIFFMHLRVIFGPLYFWDFWWFKPCFLKLIIGFWWDIDIFMIGID